MVGFRQRILLGTMAVAATSVGATKNIAASKGFIFSAGFTDDVVLQRAPAVAAIYGLTPRATARVAVTVSNDISGSTYSQRAIVMPAGEFTSGGTSDPLCQSRCLDAGHCCQGQISACQKPSCAMGCILAGRTNSANECKANCAKASNKCEFTVVSPAGPHHLPNDTMQNETFEMCSNGAILSNGTQCTSCGNNECEEGCEFGAPSGMGGGVWKALLRPTVAGGRYTVTVTSSDAPSSPIALRRVTFGDVFFCGGQSNMDLALQYSFSKPQLDIDIDIAAGKYNNIRLFQYGDMGTKYVELKPVYVTTQGVLNDPTDSGGTWGNLSAASKVIGKPADRTYNLFGQFSATCFYFAAALTDKQKATSPEVVPIGLVQSAIGGSQIEAWTPDSALGKCKEEKLNADGQAPPGRLYNGMVAPFVNMTLKGWLWYQGENNCDGNPGNSKDGVGYGCQLPAMITEWRRLWSHVPGTTDALAPFGVVSLAAGGSEGHDTNIAGIRWSQSANYGSVPNPMMHNTFLAHAYDLGDPMDNMKEPCVNETDGSVNTSAFGPNGPCIWPPASSWNAAVAPLRDTVFKNLAPSFMGGIHPRFKHEVGRRLALAYSGIRNPTLSGCVIQGDTILLNFNTSEQLLLQWDITRYNMSRWTHKDSSRLMVCIGRQAEARGIADDCMTNPDMWTTMPIRQSGLSRNEGSQSLVVELIGLKGIPPMAIRYGWPISDGADTCCPEATVEEGRMPCVPGSCPILTAKSSLPANPFYANIVGTRCQCLAPQVCDNSGADSSNNPEYVVAI